ncbi:GroES-like protein [Periconia macrospinosa]|uniref:D-xylulose reductase n=1 Tax=Periconia macrospinosa TaxID=97972 RepID=A0A2V1D9K0_9PLEO|nr:GroES-like protein [Periconia macrospinosa]
MSSCLCFRSFLHSKKKNSEEPEKEKPKVEEHKTTDTTIMTTQTATQKNPSFVLQAPGKVVYEDRPIPTLHSPYDVVVRPRWTGICGSDVHYWVEGRIGHFVVESPMVLGHESAGIVHSVGEKVTNLKVGDRVAMEPGVPCRRCLRCKEGKYNLCPDMQFAATPPFDGTLARYYTLPEDYCYKLPESMSLEEGALIEPAAVAVHITRQAAVKPGDSVVVFGAGPVGLLCCAVAKAYGATKIVTVDINDERLNFALQYAATTSFKSARVSAEENARNMIKECELGPGADIIIDASGAEPCIQTAIHALRMGGTYVQGGMGKPDINFPIVAMCTKELNVRGSFRYGAGDYQTAIDLVATKRISVKELITGKVKFEDAENAFKEVKGGKGIKILIEGPEEHETTTSSEEQPQPGRSSGHLKRKSESSSLEGSGASSKRK